MKIVRSNLDTSRQEPNLFVFEGPPGVGKSIFLNQVVSSLGWSCYSHCVPDVNEGRDFYDSYNNEDVFFMDDVGQKGVSQWRTMINMVSSVKLPLDCAEAKLKDTKFFNSHTILATTNSFSTIQSVMRSDGIADIRALWRRGFVFDFSEVKRVEGVFSGTIRFKYFDSDEQTFVFGFPLF
jgi:Holliday junction resolvasome RuvABC ATP-dependent DNA helicase subunit